MTLCSSINSRTNAAVAVALVLAGCTAPDDPAPSASASGCLPDGTGFVEAELFGGVSAALDWDNSAAACTGMPRPDDGGARLRFAGLTADRQPLVVIVGVDALSRGATGNGFAANVTVIDESTSRFFSNGGAPNCWSDIFRHADIDTDRSRVDGVVYCSGALAGVAADGSVRLRDMRFRGQIRWTGEDAGDDAP